jgi:hypothetical protein
MLNLSKRAWPVVVLALVSLTVLAPIELSQARAADGSKYAAIAYSEQTGQYGYAFGYDCLDDAENDAVANSNAADACVVVYVENGWAALAEGDNGTYGDAWSTTSLADAECQALQYCGPGNHPHIVAWCSA